MDKGIPFKFEYDSSDLKKPHFYDDPKFIERKFKEFGIQGAINSIRQQYIDSGDNHKADSMSDNDIVEQIYCNSLMETWDSIIAIESSSGKRIQGLMMNFVNDKPEMTVKLMGATKVVTHKDAGKEPYHPKGLTPVYAHCLFITIEDIINTVMKIRKMSIDDVKKSADGNSLVSENEDGNILSGIMEVCKGIIAENNPVCVTYCIDTVLGQELKNTQTGETLFRELKYSMNYTEFPNGKCIRSTYILINNDMINKADSDAQKILRDGVKNQHKDGKAMHISVADALIGSEGREQAHELMKTNKDFKEVVDLFTDHSIMEQMKKLNRKSISSLTDDLFVPQFNKYEDINNYRFYLYESKDYMIYDLANTDPQSDIRNFLDSL